MPATRLFFRSSLVLAAAAALTACAQPGSAPLPANALAPQILAPQISVFRDAAPPECKGQKDSKNSASLSVTLSNKGGSFCIPAFGGYGGTISYPKASPSVKTTVISSTTDYNNLPQLGTGTAIFYLQVTLATGTTFGSKVSPTGGLTAQAIKSGKPYTAFGQATISGAKITFGPCYSTATKGKYGGVIGGIGALLEYAVVPGKTNGFIEIYSGKQTNTKC